MPDTSRDGDSPQPSTRGVVRFGWLVAGSVCVGLGAIGVVVPGLPTTVFFIGAAAAFTRSSPRLEAWVLNLPGIGPAVRDHRAGLGMPRPAKVAALAMIAVSVTVSVIVIPSSPIRLAVIGAGLVGLVVVWRVPTRGDGPPGVET